MKKTARKVLLMACSALLLVCLTVGATVAYLTSQDSVTNTFTVGKLSIILDETDTDGSKTNVTTEGRDKANKYHLIPGSSYVKDPTVWVQPDSEASYVFVKVENGLADIEAPADDEYKQVATQITENGWSALNGVENVYYKQVAKTDENTTTKLVVFTKVKINGTINNNTLNANSNDTIKVTAYAIQAENFANANDAWTAGGWN